MVAVIAYCLCLHPLIAEDCYACLQANAAAAEEAFSTRKDSAGAVERRGVWGPRPPPQHGALVAGRLVLAAVGQAEGRTLVADVSAASHPFILDSSHVPQEHTSQSRPLDADKCSLCYTC